MAYVDSKFGKFYYFQNDSIGNTIACGEFFDTHFKPYMDRLVAGNTLIDVGANIGFFTVYCGLRGATVEAFEASPAVFGILQQNISVNGLVKVRAHNIALYDREIDLGINPEWTDWMVNTDGEIDYEAMANSGGLSLVPNTNGIWKSKTLDSYQFKKVDLLKIDAQGSDFRILVGARETIIRTQPTICFEFEHNGCGKNASGNSLEDFKNFLSELNYSMTYVGGNGHTWQDFVAEPK